MKIVLDAMGGDHAPQEIVAGAVDYARQTGHTTVLSGDEAAVRAELAKYDITGLDLPIVHAADNIQMDEKPALACRSKKENSMLVGLRIVRNGEADAFCTMGHTGGALTAGHMIYRRIRGVHRAVLTTPFPSSAGPIILGDIGANPDCRPEWLAQWGQMLSIYAQARLGIEAPRVALLSNGEEEGKGNELTRAAEPLLKSTLGDHFIGVVEPKEMVNGAANVVVTDGFTGNVVIKLSEAVAGYLFRVLREEITARPVAKIGAALARPAFRSAAAKLDDREYGAALLLGLNGILTVGHGRSKRDRVFFALRSTALLVESDMLNKIKKGVAEITVTGSAEAETVTETESVAMLN
ncbi:MAG: phosphate acyltransferase PlsX [Caldilineales bacterium]|nr:phosphate acyltransferase PlsX [Caldilineales bacterium]